MASIDPETFVDSIEKFLHNKTLPTNVLPDEIEHWFASKEKEKRWRQS